MEVEGGDVGEEEEDGSNFSQTYVISARSGTMAMSIARPVNARRAHNKITIPFLESPPFSFSPPGALAERYSKSTYRRHTTPGTASKKPSTTGARAPRLSAQYPMRGDMNEGTMRGRKIRPAPIDDQPKSEAT